MFAPRPAPLAAIARGDLLMCRDQLARRCWHAIERLREPSSAAGLAALVALLLPRSAEHAPAIVNLVLTVLAAIAALVAILRGEGNGSNGG